jgi:enoyl-CoA hydratase
MTIRSETHGETLVVTIDRPEARNAVNPEMAVGPVRCFHRLRARREAQGGGPDRCAGRLLRRLRPQIRRAGHGRALVCRPRTRRRFRRSPRPSEQGPMGPTRLLLSKPVIAAISGPAVAGGMELALWCDLRVMEASAYMGVYCRRWGVPLIDGGTVRLPRIVGHGRAMDLILTGRKVEAEECLQIGLANRLCADGKALDTALELAEELPASRRPACAPTACRQSRNGRSIRRRPWSTNGRAPRPSAPRAPKAPPASPPARAARAISGKSDDAPADHHRLRRRRHALAERAVLPPDPGALPVAARRPRRAGPHLRAPAGGGKAQSRQIRFRHQGLHPVHDRDRHRDHRRPRAGLRHSADTRGRAARCSTIRSRRCRMSTTRWSG